MERPDSKTAFKWQSAFSHFWLLNAANVFLEQKQAKYQAPGSHLDSFSPDLLRRKKKLFLDLVKRIFVNLSSSIMAAVSQKHTAVLSNFPTSIKLQGLVRIDSLLTWYYSVIICFR